MNSIETLSSTPVSIEDIRILFHHSKISNGIKRPRGNKTPPRSNLNQSSEIEQMRGRSRLKDSRRCDDFNSLVDISPERSEGRQSSRKVSHSVSRYSSRDTINQVQIEWINQEIWRIHMRKWKGLV